MPTFDDKVTKLGKHALIELSGCPPEILSDEALARETIEAAVARSGAELLQLVVHRFQPHGLTALGVLAESHVSLHTWPEHGYVAIDLFTCGDRCDPAVAYPLFAEAYQATQHSYQELIRSAPHSRVSTNPEKAQP